MTEETLSYIDIAFGKQFCESEDGIQILAELMQKTRDGAMSIPHDTTIPLPQKAPVILHENKLYLKRTWQLLQEAVSALQAHVEESIPEVSLAELPSTLYEKQAEVIKQACSSPLLLVSGGPGVGKSFTAKKLIETFQAAKPDGKVIATAPTGKALGPLKSHGVETRTLHSLLGILEHHDFTKPQKPIFADLLIVDECSMIDLSLWVCLFKALTPQTHLVLMGDPNQLPPVQGTALFSELLTLPSIPHVQLDTMMRSENTAILQLSDAICSGDVERALELLSDPNEPSISLMPLPNASDLPLDPSITYLSSYKVGPLGSDAINERFMQSLSPEKRPIMIAKNDYRLQLMNGEIGYLKKDTATFGSGDTERQIAKALLPPFESAWALTIHKSQGSEFPHVAILLPEESAKFGKTILYTAITRAKTSLTIYASRETLETMVTGDNQTKPMILSRLMGS